MKLLSKGARLLAWLALCSLPPAWSQGYGNPAATAPQRLEQTWDVAAIMGKPLAPEDGALRVVLTPQGTLQVDGSCNRFAGRYDKDAQGQFRVSRYGVTTSNVCGNAARSEALLNWALMMVNNFSWDRGLLLRGGDTELVRLSASAAAQEMPQRLEQAWDVTEIMGKPLPPEDGRLRVVMQPQGALLVDGNCNRFAGRYENGAQGQFKVSRYGVTTNNVCGSAPRSEALLNWALMMVNNVRIERGAVMLRGGDTDLVRLSLSANQEGVAAPVEQRLEQVWDVVEVMGRPLPADERVPRVVLRPQGGLLVDGGCNRFSGRYEHDGQGRFRISKYGGTHNACGVAPRSEAVLNSALMMVSHYGWNNGLVLRGGETDLVRLAVSANQDSSAIEAALPRRPAPAASSAAPSPAPDSSCRAVKGKKGKSKMVCKSSKAGKKAADKKGEQKSSKKTSGSKPRR